LNSPQCAAASYKERTGQHDYDPRGRFSLAKDQQIKDIVLKLIPQAVVTGRVIDAERKPVEGARVSVLKAGSIGGVQRWTEVAFAPTLDNGEYRIPRVGPGRYLIKCTIPW
jgi:protocatechuate 3,4-dioxygenase beta subunit